MRIRSQTPGRLIPPQGCPTGVSKPSLNEARNSVKELLSTPGRTIIGLAFNSSRADSRQPESTPDWGYRHPRPDVLDLSVVVAIEDLAVGTRLCTVLRRYGCDCRPAADLDSLLQEIEAQKPSAIVIDTTFDGRSANRLRVADRPLFEIVPVVVRADRTVDSLLQAVHLLRRGAAGVITSVDDPKELQAVLGLAPSGEATLDTHPEAARLTPLQRHERQLIVDALHRTNGHVIEAARLLQLGQATVYRKIHKYRIPRPRRQAVESSV